MYNSETTYNRLEALNMILHTWEKTDEATQEANNNDIRHYVEYGDFEQDAFINWYEGLSDGIYLDDVISEVHHLEFIIGTFLEAFEDCQYYRILDSYNGECA